MTLPIYNYNNTKIYNVSGYDTAKLPEWLIHKHKKKLKKDTDFGKRIELIQDFEFPEASNRLLFTSNGQHIVAAGVYKPQLRVFDLNQLALKLERHTNAETVSFVLLEDDWTKLALLQSDRSIEFHTQGGVYYSTRIPRAGRSMIYDEYSADLLICGSSSDIFRLNLDQGRFLAPLETKGYSSIETIQQNIKHRLVAVGGDSPYVQLWDMRFKKAVGGLTIPSNPLVICPSISSMKFLPNGLGLAIGTQGGSIFMYDIRSNKPILEKEHQYDIPIKKIEFHESRQQIVSADAKVIKVWDPNTGQLMASVEPPSLLNDVVIQQDTGFMVLANEQPQMQSFFIPALGPAPKWCAFLDNITEEMEENTRPTLYDNFKFLTKTDLETLSLGHLIGTNILRPYMHGFFIDFRLYEKAKAIANPFAYEEYKEKLVKDKISKDSATRITRKNLPKINTFLAAKLQAKSSTTLDDPRFKDLFTNEEFEIDQESSEYKRLNPSTSTKKPQYIISENTDENNSDQAASGEDFEFGIRN